MLLSLGRVGVRVWSLILVPVILVGLLSAPSMTRSALAAQGELPEQHYGSAAGRPHRVPMEATEPRRNRAQHNAASQPGGLPPDERAATPELGEAPAPDARVEVGAKDTPPDVTGFDKATSQLVADESGPKRRVFENADGTRTVRVYQGRRFFRDENGQWQRIDSTLKDDGEQFVTTADSDAKRFARVATAPVLASTSLGDQRSFGFGLADAEPVHGTVDGRSVTYESVRSDADIVLQATPMGIKEKMILHSADAPAVWEFPLHLDGVTASIDDEGSVVLRDADGAVAGRIPPGFMEDATRDPHSGEGARSYDVDYELVGESDDPVLRVRVDQEWLQDPSREFPVAVDPSVSRKDSPGSTYVLSPYTNDYSGEPNLSVGTYNGGGNKAAAYLKFGNVSSELAGQRVLGAKLWMYETWSYSCQARPVTVHPVTQPWSVGGNKSWPGPSWGAKLATKRFARGHDSGCSSGWVGIDLGDRGRNLVQGWTHGKANHGLTVRASTTDSYGWKKFASASSANPPSLAVTYTPYWAEYGVGAMTQTVSSSDDGRMQVQVTNRGKDTWTPTNGYELGYRIWDADSGRELEYGTNAAWTKMPRKVAPGQSVTIDARVKQVPPGRYKIRWDMGRRGVTRFSWSGAPMSKAVFFTIGNQTPVVGSASPPSNYESPTLTPTLTLRGRDRDAYPGKGLQYRFKLCDASGADCTQTEWQDSPRWSVPEGRLRWSQDYTWYGQLSDTDTRSAWTGAATLSPRVPQPAITSHLASAQDEAEVDPGIGNFTGRDTDASVAAVGPALAVQRTYNSRDPRRDSAFGSGWSTTWDSRVEPDGDGTGNVVVTFPDGRQARFGRNADGSYQAPPGERSTVVDRDNGGWLLKVPGAMRYAFDSAGRLATVTDVAGHSQQLSYEAGKLATATDEASGRTLSFTWSGGHVTEVDAGGNTWAYTYDGDRLTEVCDPTQACTSYAYEQASHYRTVTMDANPHAYWRLSENGGSTAVSEVPGFWGDVDGTAVDVDFGRSGPLAGSPSTAAGFNGTSSHVRLPDDLVRESQYASMELWFNTTSEGVLFSTSNYLPGAAEPKGSMPALYVGSDGKLHGHFWNESVAGIVSEVAVNDGQWHHVVLSGAYDTQTLYLDGAEVGSQDGQLVNIDPYDFLGAGALNDRDWPSEPATDGGAWNYFDGQIAEAAFYQHPLSQSTVSEHYAARQRADVLTEITRPGGHVAAKLAYDKADDRVTRYTDANGGVRTIGAPVVQGDGHRYGNEVRSSGPDSHWRLAENDGTSAPGSPTLRRGTYHGGTQSAGPFPNSHARSFDGSRDYARLPDGLVRSTRQGSVSLWFKTTASDGGVLFSTSDHLPGESSEGGAVPLLYVGTDGKLHGHFWQGSVPGMASEAVVNDGDWHQVVLAGDDTTQTLFLDGVQIGSLDGTIQNLREHVLVGTGWTRANQWPQIGDRDWASFNGRIAHLGWYPNALPATAVSGLYESRTDQGWQEETARAWGVDTLWPLDEVTQAEKADVVAGTTAATHHDVDTSTQPPMPGAGGVGLNGTSSYVRLPDHQIYGRTRTSVEMWFKTSARTGGALYATGRDLPGDSGGGAYPVLYVGTDGLLRGGFWDGDTTGITSDNVVNDGDWHHVALTGDGTQQRMYLDGQLVGSRADGRIANIDRYEFVGTGRFDEGWPEIPQGWGYFEGQIGEVAVYHSPLDAARIQAHYAASVAATAVTTTDPAGDRTTHTFDPTKGGRHISVDRPGPGARVYAYDTGGFVRKVTDENGHVTRFVNDAHGNRLSSTACRDGGVEACYTSYTSYFWNDDDPLDPRNGQVTESRDGRSSGPDDDRFLTHYTYTADGNVASASVPGANGGAQRTTTHTYTDGSGTAVSGGTEPAGLLKTTTDPAGGVTRYAYTQTGDLARVTDAAGKVTAYDYDDLGRKTSETVTSDALGTATTTYRYDAVGRLVEQVDPEAPDGVTDDPHQRRTTNTYNPDGTLSSVTVDDVAGDDEARTTSYTYDDHGRVHTVTGPAGGVTTTTYDTFGSVTREVAPSGTEFTATYTTGRHQLATRTVHGYSGDGKEPRDVVLESRAYDPAGRLASVTDAMGRTTSFSYYNDNLLEAEAVEGGRSDPDTGEQRPFYTGVYRYDGAGQVTKKWIGHGRYTTTTSYDNAGRVAKTVDREGDEVLRSSETTYDVLDNPVHVVGKNADGSRHSDVESDFDALGRPTSQTVYTGSEALTTRTTRDQAGLVTAVVGPRGTAAGADADDFTTEYSYDALGRQVGMTAPPVEVENGGNDPRTLRPTTTTGYNTFGEPVAQRDPAGNVTRKSFDAAGRETSTTLPRYTPPDGGDAISPTTRIRYDKAGRVTATVDAQGRKTTYRYDELGHLRGRTDPPLSSEQPGGEWTATHDPLGERLSVTDPTGARTHATYDVFGRRATSTVVERVPGPTRNLTTRYTYDELGNPATVTSPSGVVTKATWDDAGNRLSSTDGLGNTTTATFDGAGNQLTVTDPTGRSTRYDYDLAGRRVSASDTNAAGEQQRKRTFDYDRAGNRTGVTDALGHTTTRTYDALDRVRSVTRPVAEGESITRSYGYDAAGHVTRATDGNGHATVFTVNAWGLPESTIEPATPQTPDAADRTYTAVYGLNGRLARLVKPGGVTVSNSYDPLGNLTKQVGSGASAVTPDRTFTYDTAGRLTGVSAPGGINEFEYDDRGNLVSATGPSGSSSYAWDDDGRQVSATTSAGTARFGYDGAGRLASAADPLTGTSVSYGYDDAGRVTSTGYGDGRASRVFGYDGLGRLTSDEITAPDGTVSASIAYGYDKADRLTSKTTTGVAGAADNTYAYDRAGRLTSFDDGDGAHSYGWDAAGNLVRDGALEATFDARNRLVSKDGTSYAYTPRGTLTSRTSGGETTRVQFNAFGELVADGATAYAYDGLGRLVSAGDAALSYAGSGISVTGDGADSYTYTPGGDVLGVASGDGAASVAWTDRHTDLVGVFDPADGQLAGSRAYGPFGQQTAGEGVEPGLGYQHQYTDPESGNVNMGVRWYQPDAGTFASRDTTGLDPRDVGNANRYAYVGGDPLGRTDPTGRCPCVIPIIGITFGEAAAAVGGATAVTGALAAAPHAADQVESWTSDTTAAPPAPTPTPRPPQRSLKDLWDATAGKWWKNTGQSWWRGAARWAGRIGDQFDELWSSPGPGPNRPPSLPGRNWTLTPDGGPGSSSGWLGHGGSSHTAAAAARRAYQAWLAARRQRVIDDAMTPHALPDSSKRPVVAPSVQRAIEAAEGASPVRLGVLNPSADGEEPYQPQQQPGGAAEPDGVQSSHLWSEECATGGEVRRNGTGWECTTLDSGDTAQPGTISNSGGDQPYGFSAGTGETAWAVPNPEPVLKPNGTPDRSSPWYVSYRDADGNLQTVGNLDDVHAEVRIQQLQPGASMSKPFGWRTRDSAVGPEWVEGTVCADCQVFPRGLFAPGTRGAPGGPWGGLRS
ncbi:RHS repeat-associated core domain-containing protein [Prauserella aidingensis]|nr:RHS repeat-associated core domain-containing protein [Prauserella aidingensis]